MVRKYFLPTLSILGAVLGLFVVFWCQKEVPIALILFPPPQSPYPYAIAAAGIIESSSDNISIGSPFDEIIEKIYVTEGDYVKKGDPLFQLDTRTFTAEVHVAEASLKAALTDFEDKSTQFAFYEQLKNKHAVSEQIYEQYRYALFQAKDSIKIAESNLELAKTAIQRSTILAPISGRILQVNIHVGEIAPIIPLSDNQSTWQTAAQGSLIIMGIVDPLQVRINIDEADAWRYENNAPATAFVQGNSRINFPLSFHRVEPYIIPKSSFTGQTTERVDTRVLQVLYTFEKNNLPIYVGQVLDIFIESKPIQAAS